MSVDPRHCYPRPPFKAQPQRFPGLSSKMTPEPDYGEKTYRGSGKLKHQVALITGGDSGIGRAVALAFAREGADVAIAYLESEESDARDIAAQVEAEGRRCELLPGDLRDAKHCSTIIEQIIEKFGRLDILVNNAAFQKARAKLEQVTEEEWQRHFDTNTSALFHLTKAALLHLKPGASIINTSSVNLRVPQPILVPYSMTKAAIANFTVSMAQQLAGRGIRVNAVLPGPIWTPFIATGMPVEDQEEFGTDVPLGRPGQPAELAGAYVYFADPLNSYTSGALLTVNGGTPML
ncbi:SDR family oxidoreductase [Gluconobacter morbifer]|uniref:Putative oxidoreductase n=1 Tax=Gluconobacter morbifer G707 TaxID=1088869 RepID=G6XKL9_9PROT|nr:SDR family oxidoreductase [Gluconobacter morbifer]EHH67815.1 putative oxidoreductase [Gluconobacter morbifer G707]